MRSIENRYFMATNVGNCIRYKWKEFFPRNPNTRIPSIFDATDLPSSKHSPSIIKCTMVAFSTVYCNPQSGNSIIMPRPIIKKLRMENSIEMSTINIHIVWLVLPMALLPCTCLTWTFFNRVVYIPPRAPNKKPGMSMSGNAFIPGKQSPLHCVSAM